MAGENLSDSFEDDIFSVLEAWESASNNNNNNNNNNLLENYSGTGSKEEIVRFEVHKSSPEVVDGDSPGRKRQKVAAASGGDDSPVQELGQQRMLHISVERNRRKQMNDNLSVLRSLMPCFYVKRGDQASIIEGVVDYINELQQLIQALEAKKQRKFYSHILSPRPISSPKLSPLSPRKPPLSPRLSLPVSPQTPQPASPYKPYMHHSAGFRSPPSTSLVDPSPCNSSMPCINDAVNELVACSKSAVAEVEVKLSGPNLLLRTVSCRGPGLPVRIVAVLEELDLEILHVKISTVHERVLNMFTIKIGIDCQLSAEELAHQIHQTFC